MSSFCRANVLYKSSHCVFADVPAAYYYVLMTKSAGFITFLAVFVSCGASVSPADQVIMQNGDVLNGKVLAVTTNTLELQDDNLGNLTLARINVMRITFGAVAAETPASATPLTNSIKMRPQPIPQTNSFSDLQPMFREIREHSNLVQEVEAQVLGSSASPEAVNKFNELLDGLSTGKIDMNELRAEARSAADQLQEYKKEMGPDAGEEVDGYLSILNNFLRETAPTNGASP